MAQQIMALIRQNGGASLDFADSSVTRATGQPSELLHKLVAHMLESDVLFEDSGVLGIGTVGERLYGAKNFMALSSVFDTPPLCQVMCGVENLGSVHPFSFANYGQQTVVISLSGRPWEVIHFDRQRSIAHVIPTDAPGRSRWLGESIPLSHRLCRAVRDLLSEEQHCPLWSKRAVSEITAARSEGSFAKARSTVVCSETGNRESTWWTFGGQKANATLAQLITQEGGTVSTFDNYAIEFKFHPNFKTANTLLESVARSLVREFVTFATTPSSKVKFWECLPVDLQERFLTARYFDISRASSILSEPLIWRST
jgi:ATP-dependent Lhr-like helicase